MDRAVEPSSPQAPRPIQNLPDTDLSSAVRDAQRGDEEAFRLLFRAVQPRLLRYLRGIVADEAEDVASEAWLQIPTDLGPLHRALAGLPRFPPPPAPPPPPHHPRPHHRPPPPPL